MGQRQRADLDVFMAYTIHHQAKYQRLNANTLYVAAILFSRSTLHIDALLCLPNKQILLQQLITLVLQGGFQLIFESATHQY